MMTMLVQTVLLAGSTAVSADVIPTDVPTTAPTPVSLRIDPSQRHQTIEGFGASGCWTAQLTGDWPEASRTRALDLLFTDQGAALSIWRYNIGVGDGEEIHDRSRRTKSVEVAPGQYDLSRDQAALDMVRGGVDRGVERVILFANSVPARFTVSGKVSGGEDGTPNVRPGTEADVARFLVDITLLIKRELSLKDVRLSPMNEPQWTWGAKNNRRQEGCNMLPDQLALLSGECAKQLLERDPTVLLEGPEGGQWHGTTFDYVAAFMKDPVLMKQMAVLAVHSYWSDDTHRREFMDKYRAAGLTIPISQTEWCEMKWERDAGMNGAFTMFRTMHSDLTICNVVSWTFWLAMSNYDYRDGLIYIEKDNTLTPAKRLYTMGHYSRFLRPGAVRVQDNVSDPRVLSTSYLTRDGKQIVSVLANPTNDALRLSLESTGMSIDSQARVFVTTEEANLVESRSGLAGIAVPAQSIVTVVAQVSE